MNRELSGSEAVYAFCGWLSGRKEVTKMSEKHDCAVIASLIDEFCKSQQLSEPGLDWHKVLYNYPA